VPFGESIHPVARAISIAGHPVVLISCAGLIAASAHGASPVQMRTIGVTLAMLAVTVVAFTWFQVKAGRWAHVDASARAERSSLNWFLATLLLASAALVWFGLRNLHMSVALVLSATLIVAALLLARWVKMSLHVAFAAFATSLLWPMTWAVVAGILVTAAVAWSRLTLGRHVAADVVAGLLLGTLAGGAYAVWLAR
jgi:membrane-associated phospholipid phosphatase